MQKIFDSMNIGDGFERIGIYICERMYLYDRVGVGDQ